MDNQQGDYQIEQLSGDDDIQNNADLDLATETLQQVQLNPSSSSLIVENDQRLPVRFLETNINPPHQDILQNNGVIGGFWLPEPVVALGSSSGPLIGIPLGFPYTLYWTNFLHYQGESSSEPSLTNVQDGYHPFLNFLQNTMGASATNQPSVHPFGYANINQVGTEGLNLMPFFDHRNINGNVTLGPYETHFHSIYEGSANYPGYYNFPGNFYPSNVPFWIPLANVFEHQTQIPTGILNNPSVQDMDPHNIAAGGSRPDIHAVVHYEPYFTTLLTSPIYEMRNWLEATWVYTTLEFLRTQFEQWTLLDYAWLVSRILDERQIINQPIEEEEELEFLEDDIPNELLGLIIFEDEDEHVGMGLSEEEIVTHIRLEKLECVDEETPEICCICQDDFVNGEEVGRLDCVHRYHVGCIKEWLVRRNICPICRRTALAIDNDEDA